MLKCRECLYFDAYFFECRKELYLKVNPDDDCVLYKDGKFSEEDECFCKRCEE